VSVGEFLDVAIRWAFGAAIPGAGIWYFKERRKSRAADEVAERTVPAEIRIKDSDALNAHIAAVERAFEVERESKDRRIAEQDQQITELKAEVRCLTDKDRDNAERIAALRDELRALNEQVRLLMSARLTEEPRTRKTDRPTEETQ
jgi:hypothetical protein